MEYFRPTSGNVPKMMTMMRTRPGAFVSSILRYDERQIKDGARSPLAFLREALGSSGRMSANPLRMSNSLLSTRSYMVEDTPKSDFRD